jgi:spore coat protein A
VKISPCDAAGGRRAFDGGAAVISRRQFLKGGAVGGAALLVPWETAGRAWAAIPGGSLDPTTIGKYAAPLVIPPVMPPLTGPRNQSIDRYAIAVRQFRQQILPPGLPATTVWSYGSAPTAGRSTTRRSRSRPGSTGRSG